MKGLFGLWAYGDEESAVHQVNQGILEHVWLVVVMDGLIRWFVNMVPSGWFQRQKSQLRKRCKRLQPMSSGIECMHMTVLLWDILSCRFDFGVA